MNKNLDKYQFSSYEGFNAQLMRWRYEAFEIYYRGRTCLELGSADGQGTEFLLNHFEQVTAVDGSKEAIARLRQKLANPKLTAIHSHFEDLDISVKSDTVILAHILEHVDHPATILAAAKRFVKPKGVIIIDVPNALSLHRQIGVEMGLLKHVTDLNDADRSIGHQRVYTPAAFKAEIATAGLKIQHFGGVFMKLLSNAQTEALFSPDQLQAFLEVGKHYPEIASEMYIVATI